MTLAPMTSTQAVLDHHLHCFGGGDLPGILTDYAPDAILFTPTGTLRGTQELSGLFEGMFAEFAEFAKPGATFDSKLQAVDGDYAYIIRSAETADNTYELATDTFVLRDGKIVAQSFAGKITPKS